MAHQLLGTNAGEFDLKKKVKKKKKSQYELTELTRLSRMKALHPSAEKTLNKFDEAIARDGQQKLSGQTNESLEEWSEEGKVIERLSSARYIIQYDSFFIQSESDEGPRISFHIVIGDNDLERLHYTYSLSPTQHGIAGGDNERVKREWYIYHQKQWQGLNPLNRYWPASLIKERAKLSARYITSWLEAELENAAQRIIVESAIYDLIDETDYIEFLDARLQQETARIARRFGVYKASGRPVGSTKPKEETKVFAEKEQWLKDAIVAIQTLYKKKDAGKRELQKDVAAAMGISCSKFTRRLKAYEKTFEELLEIANRMSRGKKQKNSS